MYDMDSLNRNRTRLKNEFLCSVLFCSVLLLFFLSFFFSLLWWRGAGCLVCLVTLPHLLDDLKPCRLIDFPAVVRTCLPTLLPCRLPSHLYLSNHDIGRRLPAALPGWSSKHAAAALFVVVVVCVSRVIVCRYSFGKNRPPVGLCFEL